MCKKNEKYVDDELTFQVLFRQPRINRKSKQLQTQNATKIQKPYLGCKNKYVI